MDSKDRHQIIENCFSELEPEILTDIGKSKFPQTFNCLYYKIKTIDLIKDGIVNSSNNLYATQILHRSLIEHSLLGYYIFLKWKIDASDDIGIDFRDAYANSEFFKQETYTTQSKDIKTNTSRTVDIEVLKQQYSEIAKLTQQDLEEYHRAANQFSNVKKIGDYLIRNKDYEPRLDKVNMAIFELLEQYNLLSSYVHGGPYAERETFYSETETNDDEILENIANWAYTLAGLIKCLLVLALNKEFHERYSEPFKNIY